MKAKLTVLGMMGLLSMHCYSGDKTGNGGDAVVCYRDSSRQSISSIQLFDYWEMDHVLHYSGGIQLGAMNLPVSQKIAIAVGRIAKFDPDRAKEINKIAMSMADNIESVLVTGYELPDIEDTNPRAIPGGNCFIEQFAVQWKDTLSGQRRFAISAKFYNHLATNNNTRAGIILHEAIYRNAILAGQTTSEGTRLFNYTAAVSKLDTAALDQYAELLQESKFGDPSCKVMNLPFLGGLVYLKDDPQYSEGNYFHYLLCLPQKIGGQKIKMVLPTNSSIAQIGSDSAWVRSVYNRNGFNWELDAELQVFYQGQWEKMIMKGLVGRVSLITGKLLAFTQAARYPTQPIGIPPLSINPPNQEPLPCDTGTYVLSATEDVLMCRLAKNTIYKHQQQPIVLAGNSYAEFDENYHLVTAYLASAASLPVRGSYKNYIFKGNTTPVPVSQLRFDEEGKVIHGTLETPLKVTINSIPEVIRFININTKTNMLEVVVDQEINHMVQGKKVLAGEREENRSRALAMCRASTIGYDTLTNMTISQEYVGATKEFYDSLIKKFVMKADSDIATFDKIKCSGTFKLQLP